MRCIDADALFREMEKAQWYNNADRDEIAEELVLNAPTIEPQRKKGMWLPDNNSVYEMRFICSECKESQVVPTIGFTKYKPIWDYCPNCGSFNGGENEV